MEEDLKPVAMYIITHHIWNTVRKELRKRLLIIDEAWWMMRSEDTASFLFGIAKRGRKYYLGIATITQDVSDFLNSPYGIPMITNSSIQILLRQSPTSVDLVQQTFKLSDEEKYLLLESDVGEGIFFAGLKHVAIKVIASYTEDQIITSDPSQILAIKKAKQDLEIANDAPETPSEVPNAPALQPEPETPPITASVDVPPPVQPPPTPAPAAPVAPAQPKPTPAAVAPPIVPAPIEHAAPGSDTALATTALSSHEAPGV
jgi:hypothetical protein